VFVGLLAGCAEERRVVYSLEWDVAGLSRPASGVGWEIVTDLGYRVQLDAGYLSSHSVELIECDYRPQPLARLVSGLVASLVPAPAFAGHVLSPNPSAFRTTHVESLVAAAPITTSRIVVGGRRYCEVSYLVARAEVSAAGLPGDLDMAGKSLYVAGMYSLPGTAPERFAIASTVASGGRVGFFAAGHFGDDGHRVELDTASGDVVVRIRRRLGSLFDGVDFARQPRSDWAHAILANLVDDLTVVAATNEGSEP
jgi:hypothetical protein